MAERATGSGGHATGSVAGASGPGAVTVLVSGTLMASVDVSVANVAGPRILTDLPATPGQLELVLCGYSIAYAALLVTGARLGSRWGHARLFQAGLVLFTVASAACGLAPDAVWLIAMRVLQGTGAAAMVPQVFTTIQLTVPAARRATALGWNAASVAAGGVLGQLIGGLLVSADIAGTGWRAVFLVNIPIGLALVVLAHRLLPVTEHVDAPVDVLGTALLATTVAATMVALIYGPTTGWHAWALTVAAAALAGLAALAWWLRRGEWKAAPRILDLAVLRRPALQRGLAVIAVVMAAYGGFLLTFTTHTQLDQGATPATAGALFSAYALGFATGSLLAGRPTPHINAATALTVMALAHLGLGLTDHFGTTAEPLTLFTTVVLLVVAGTGYGIGFTRTVTNLLAATPPPDVPQASGALNVTIQVGYLIGVATIGTYYLTHHTTPTAYPAVAAAIAALVAIAAAATLTPAKPGSSPAR